MAEAATHLVAVQAGAVANLLVFAQPVDSPTLARVDAVSLERGFVRLWPLPEGAPANTVAAAVGLGPGFFSDTGFDLTPSTDDRPFFFQTLDLLDPPPAAVRSQLGTLQPAVVLRDAVLVLGALTLVLFFFPFIGRRRWPASARLGRATAFFATIGVAFMFAEIPLVQRMTLYLGHPSRGAAVALGGLLLGAGAGSRTVSRASIRYTTGLLTALPFVLLAIGLAIGPVMSATAPWSLPMRVGCAGAGLLVVGFFLGTAFPAGMIRFDDVDRSWLWAVNGACSVLASALALAVAMIVGCTVVIVVGALGYLVVALLWQRSERPA